MMAISVLGRKKNGKPRGLVGVCVCVCVGGGGGGGGGGKRKAATFSFFQSVRDGETT